KTQEIKNLADQRALDLARDIQHYRDEQANRLGEQIASERGQYITRTDHDALIARFDALIKPLSEFVAAQQGKLLGEQGSRSTANDLAGRVIAGLSLLVSVAVAVFLIVHGGWEPAAPLSLAADRPGPRFPESRIRLQGARPIRDLRLDRACVTLAARLAGLREGLVAGNLGAAIGVALRAARDFAVGRPLG